MRDYRKNNNVYIYKTKTDKRPYKVVIMRINDLFHFASFYNMEQLKRFLKNFDIKLKYIQTWYQGTDNEIKVYKTNYLLKDNVCGFWTTPKLTKNYKSIKALSNGSIVDCYIKTDNRSKTKELLRPNPNAKQVYNPLTTGSHIEHQRVFGIY